MIEIVTTGGFAAITVEKLLALDARTFDEQFVMTLTYEHGVSLSYYFKSDDDLIVAYNRLIDQWKRH